MAPCLGQKRLIFCVNFPLFPYCSVAHLTCHMCSNWRLYAHFVVAGHISESKEFGFCEL